MKRIGTLILSLFVSTLAIGQLSVDASDTVACEGTDIVLTAEGADVYSWSSVMSLDTNAGDSVNSSPPVGSFTVTVIGYDTVLNDTDTVMISIVINPNPNILIMSSAASDGDYICLGSSAELTAISDTSTLASVMWSPSADLDTNMGQVVMASPDTTKTFTAVVTNDYGCTASGTKIVKVGYDYPVFRVEVAPDEICPGDSATLTAIPSGIVNKVEWSPSSLTDASTGLLVKAGPTTSTTFTATATKFGCKLDTSFEVSVLTPPVMNYTQSSGGDPIKLDETDVITVACATCESYIWKFPSSTLETTSNVQVVSPNEPGDIDIKITGYDANECKSSVVATVVVDSAFAGTPFGLNSVNEDEVNVKTIGKTIMLQSAQPMDEAAVFNLLGEEVSKLRVKGATTAKIELQTQPEGMYIVVINASGKESISKVYLR